MPGETLEAGRDLQLEPLHAARPDRSFGGVHDDIGIVPDQLDATRAALKRAAEHNDLIVTCGGVSVGEEDHLKPALEKEGRLDLWQIAIKPGKPLAFGEVFRADGLIGMVHRPARQSGLELRHLPVRRCGRCC